MPIHCLSLYLIHCFNMEPGYDLRWELEELGLLPKYIGVYVRGQTEDSVVLVVACNGVVRVIVTVTRLNQYHLGR